MDTYEVVAVYGTKSFDHEFCIVKAQTSFEAIIKGIKIMNKESLSKHTLYRAKFTNTFTVKAHIVNI